MGRQRLHLFSQSVIIISIKTTDRNNHSGVVRYLVDVNMFLGFKNITDIFVLKNNTS